MRILVINKCLFDDEVEYFCEVRIVRIFGMLIVVGKSKVFFYGSIGVGKKIIIFSLI